MKRFLRFLIASFSLASILSTTTYANNECRFLVAAAEGKLATVKHLVENLNVDINASGSLNMTALHYSLNNGFLNDGQCEVAEYLIKKGASIDIAGGFSHITARQLIDMGYCEDTISL